MPVSSAVDPPAARDDIADDIDPMAWTEMGTRDGIEIIVPRTGRF